MRTPYLRLVAFLGLVGLYSLSPVLGVLILGAGFTYALVRHRAHESVEGSFTTLNLG